MEFNYAYYILTSYGNQGPDVGKCKSEFPSNFSQDFKDYLYKT